ncbi:MAG: lamin tail domain-containing protein, partial [Anaerolineae bacterium]|nr:lamin tail domain-containing protein [Anaerolineae bacterium]
MSRQISPNLTSLRSATSTVLITEVLFDGYQYNDMDEAIALTNIGYLPIDLTGWELCKLTTSNLYCTSLPHTMLHPGQKSWFARDGNAFSTSFGTVPDYVLSPWINLANDGAVVSLRDINHVWIDTVIIGEPSATGIGWSGPGVNAYYNYLRGTEGQILKRIPDEITGLPIQDTDTSQDWIQNPQDAVTGRRVWYPGWVEDPLFWSLATVESATVSIGVAPDNAYELIEKTILLAQDMISIEIYTISNPHLLPILIQKANEGVKIKVLLEGNPVGIATLATEWQNELYICSELERAGGECWFMMHDPTTRVFNRYEYLHSKLMIIDNQRVIIGTQNFTRNSLPTDEKSNGTYGSRGCVIVTDAPEVIARAQMIFALDADHEAHNDLIRWNTGSNERYWSHYPDLVDLSFSDYISNTTHFTQPLVITGTFGFELITSPESSPRHTDALFGLLNQAGAGDSILVEQMYELSAWGDNPESAPNLRLQSYVAAAQRGAKVRILLNAQGFTSIPSPPEENLDTIAYLNMLGRNEGLDIQAATGNPTGGGIHNKMILVDLKSQGQFSHIGSLNGSETSHKVNREIAIQIKSSAVYAYLERVFTFDWWLSQPTLLPLIVKSYASPEPPVSHLVISEVYYNSDPATEWIEIYNPNAVEVNLDGYKLGDAQLPTSYEPMFSFPPSSTIQSGQYIVIAVNGVEVDKAIYEFYESDPHIANMVPDDNWGSQNYPFSLRDAGDEVLLLNETYQVIDSFIWGDAILPGIQAHPGK